MIANPIRVFEIAPQKFALGEKGRPALSVVRRKLASKSGHGRPRYKGVRGRRPIIPVTLSPLPPIEVSAMLMAALRSFVK